MDGNQSATVFRSKQKQFIDENETEHSTRPGGVSSMKVLLMRFSNCKFEEVSIASQMHYMPFFSSN
ncbi:CLUMA_CG013713, isoform A [Clunio marinus]|uniref:CLUMA_CG013713, isoform A n=1 Tax=Clunio marinus TaxID=568069 RepID=A0A1J1IL14_9DIPT|nr:CLUMA_CG013713, isoform A [Clunio marinus]